MPRPIKPRLISFSEDGLTAYVPLTQGQIAIIDAEDAERVGKYAWHAAYNAASDHWYARRKLSVKENNPRIQFCFLHEFILGYREGYTVDHIFREHTLDNRKANLRHATNAEQVRNRKFRRGAKSGYRGVYFEQRKKLYRAIIVGNGKRIGLGRYKTAEDAAIAYDKAAISIFGIYAQPNFPRGESCLIRP